MRWDPAARRGLAAGVAVLLAVALAGAGVDAAQAVTDTFKLVFQDNDNVLAGYSNSGSSFTTTYGMAAGTSPSVALLANGVFVAAFEANNDYLGMAQLGGSVANTTLEMAAGTDPSIAALPGGGWVAAFQGNDNALYIYNSLGGVISTGLGMDAGTSPAVAVQPDGSFKVVFTDNDDVLAGYNSTGSNFTTTAGLAAGTSPSIAAEPDGTYEAAAQANTGDLSTFHLGNGVSVNNTTLGMDAGTSPAVAVQPDGSFKVVFTDNDDVLAGYNSTGSSFTTTAGLAAGTSPSITTEPDGTYEAAAQANTGDLSTFHLGNGVSVNNTTLGMDAGASPSLALPAPAAPTGPPPLGPLPAMGYNTWYQYGATTTESDVLEQAHYLVSSGLAAAGYDTVNLDDGWLASSRTGDGSLTWNTTKFPHGIPWLASQIHALGLRFGIYEAIGTRTCQNLPGSGGTTASNNHYVQDAGTFADWGVDFVKIDECNGLPPGTTLSSLTASFEQYGSDLRAANPSVLYSEELPIYALGQPDFTQAVQSSSTFANMWRVAGDERPSDTASDTILGHLAADLHLHAFAGPGHWNDLDMLVPGTPASSPFGWSLAEQESQLSVWAEEASPLLISTDLTTLTPDELAALKNPDIIAIDQSGTQAATAMTSGNIEAVIKPTDRGMAVLFANLGTTTDTGTFTLSQLGINAPEATGYNVWANQTTSFSSATVTLPAGQTETMLIKPAG